jgi:POT family proton-dependent oligopeptide transporter
MEYFMALYGTYTMWVYFTPCNWGFLADRYLGYRWAVVLGALAMTLGHASMAVETFVFIYWNWVSYY